ncbi:MAG: glycosyltransferase [Thermofilaceae archaeon]
MRVYSGVISVVVPTRNNEGTIVELLESLARQTLGDFEVIVADSSSDRTPEIASRYPFVRVVRVPPAGINVARNAGLRAARGEIVAFTDGDCRAPPDWLESVRRFFEEHPDAAAVGGSVLTAREISGSTTALYYNEALWPMMTIYEQELEITARNFHRVRVPNGNNMAFKREVLLGNPFDEGIKGGYDEVELLWRLCRAGYRVYASPTIRVEHFHGGGLGKMLKRAFSYGRGHTMFFLKHRKAPLALYGLLGALALYSFYASAALLAVIGLPHLLLIPPLAYLALAALYLAKGRGLRSLAYPLFDISFYSTMAAGMLYELARRGLPGKRYSRRV